MTDVLWPLAAVVIALLAWDACKRYLSGMRKGELDRLETEIDKNLQAANEAAAIAQNAVEAKEMVRQLAAKVDRLDGKLSADAASRSFEGQRSQLPKVSFARRKDAG